MKGALYLRDVRHLEKSTYILADKLFYERYETHYKHTGEYRDLARAMAALNECQIAIRVIQ